MRKGSENSFGLDGKKIVRGLSKLVSTIFLMLTFLKQTLFKKYDCFLNWFSNAAAL